MLNLTRRAFIGVLGTAVASGCLYGCSGGQSSSGGSGSEAAATKVTLGTLATEDILPMWVALDEGMLPADVAVEIVVFQSATELIAGVASGEVDMAMTDIMVAASLFAGGAAVKLEWVTLGATADQGRFGIMVGPNSDVSTLSDLAGVPIGVGSNTILEYVMDCLMAEAGVPDDQVLVEELPKLPVRYQLMLSGEVKAAALPASLLALGEAQGCRVVADDTQGENISQSVMVSRVDFTNTESGTQAIAAVQQAWDKAADAINAEPEKYRKLLVTSANLPDDIAETYPVSTYPTAQRPTAQMVEPVLKWARAKGYLEKDLSYDESTGSFS